MTLTTAAAATSNTTNSQLWKTPKVATPEKMIYSDRLVWIEVEDAQTSTAQFWPAVVYDEYGQVLRQLHAEMDRDTNAKLSAALIACRNEGRVARLLRMPSTGNNNNNHNLQRHYEFIHLSKSQAEPLNFYSHLGRIMDYAKKAGYDKPLHRALDTVTALLQQDLHHKTVVPSQPIPPNPTKSTFPVSDEDGSASTQESAATQDSWQDLWSKLRKSGWRWRVDPRTEQEWYVKPNRSLSKGIRGVDYFTQSELQQYLQTGMDNKEPLRITTTTATQPVVTTVSKKRKATDKGRIWGRAANKKATTNHPPKEHPYQTPDRKTKPQDPGKPLLSDSSSSLSSSDEDRYSWPNVWPRLKCNGWAVVKARNILHDWYYVKPEKSVSTGVMGVDYFITTDDVIDYIRVEDECEKHDNTKKRRVALQPPLAPSPATTSSESDDSERFPSHWFYHEPLPSFRVVWMYLQKLGFRYGSGQYMLPKGYLNAFRNDHLLRSHLIQYGIPNLSLASEEEKTVLERWVAFAHVPVKEANSVKMLRTVSLLPDAEAKRILTQELGFDERNGKFCRGEQTFESLSELRVFVRAAESLEVPGKRRRVSTEHRLKPAQVMELRLWAATSPEPLPSCENSVDDLLVETPPVATPNSNVDHVPANVKGLFAGITVDSEVSVDSSQGDSRRLTLDSIEANALTQPR